MSVCVWIQNDMVFIIIGVWSNFSVLDYNFSNCYYTHMGEDRECNIVYRGRFLHNTKR